MLISPRIERGGSEIAQPPDRLSGKAVLCMGGVSHILNLELKKLEQGFPRVLGAV